MGDPIGEGNDAGVPDIPYMGYLNNGNDDEEFWSQDSSTSSNHVPRMPKENASKKENKPLGKPFEHYLNKAREFSKDGDYSRAVMYYDFALEKRRDDDALIEKAECLHKLNKDNEASKCYYDLSWVKSLSSNEKEAMFGVKYLKKAVELNPNNDEALSKLGHALVGWEKYSEALTYFKRVNNENVDWHMAMCYKNLGQYPDAIELFNKCLEEHPLRGDWLCQKCECLYKSGREDEAIAEFKNFIDFLVSNDCYHRVVNMIEDLSKKINDENFFKYEKEEYSKNELIMNRRHRAVLDAINDYLMENSDGLKDYELRNSRNVDDLKGFVQYITEKSGESIDDILKWYYPPVRDVNFDQSCERLVHESIWPKIVQMNKEGKFKDL